MWEFGGQLDKIWPTPLVFRWIFCPILDVDFPVVGFQPGWVSVFLVDWFYLSLSQDISSGSHWQSCWSDIQAASILIIPARVLTGRVCPFTALLLYLLIWFTFSTACIWLIEIDLSNWVIIVHDLLFDWLRVYYFALVICFCFVILYLLCYRRFKWYIYACTADNIFVKSFKSYRFNSSPKFQHGIRAKFVVRASAGSLTSLRRSW